jgi:peptide/nickel transport system permease protein
VMSARRPYGPIDNWLSIAALGGISLPGFWFGLVLMWVFAGILHVLPASGAGPTMSLQYTALDMVPYFVLPTVVLASGLLPPIMRYTRSSMLDALAQDYVRTARSKGLRERAVIVGHALKNALIPVATIIGPATAGLVTGSFIIESLFNVPGMGRLYIISINARDYPMIMSTTLLYAFIIMVANITVDIIYGMLDPRIKVA